MYCSYFVLLLGCLTGYTYAGYQQFYYTNAVQQPNFYHQPIQQSYYQQPYYQQYIPTAYTPIPRVLPAQYRYQQAPAPFQYLQVQDNRNFNVQSRGNVQPQATQEVKNDYESQRSDSFRGFAYHTEFEHGGRSNVIFITGPEVNKFREAHAKPINPHTSASDAVDSHATTVENQSIEALVRFFENPKAGIQKFYSVNNALITRNAEEVIPQYPASTLPLREPISPIFPVLRSRFALDENTEKMQARDSALGSATEIESKTLKPEVVSSTVSTTTIEDLSTTTAASATSITTEVSTSTTTELSTSPSSTTTITTTEVPITTVRSTMAPIVVEDISNESTTSS